ncbi:NAD(P)H-quinone oxidoreductase subunit I [Frankliniella fusca]|uniref:NAD(P)H-quinone oxidoreductase subunit I n=1 Tax=Frankliniella fusca TaxID=407009 RepID=A0AAE1LHT5_9NEOP|nr:NAD(P)H-quinone oxidoreductase subunit I [Frankliniella fusca]
MPFLRHEQFPEQASLHLHLTKALQDSAATGIVLHTGTHFPFSCVQPQSVARGRICFVWKACLQICACSAALRVCCSKESIVGGRSSIWRLYLVKSALRQATKFSYILDLKIINYRFPLLNATNASRHTGYASNASIAFDFPWLWKEETVSHPVKA